MTDNIWRRRAQTGLTWFFGAVGLIFLFVVGLWIYVSATAKPLHPDAQQVPSVPRAAAARQWADAVEQSRTLVRATLAEHNLPGLSVAVGLGGDIVWAEGFGWADLEKKLKVSPDSMFRIGTASMALTSAAVGLLVEQRKLNLDDEIQTYVPTYPRKQWPVTVRELMGQLAGVRNDAGDEGPYGEYCERPVDGLKLFADKALLFEPGTKFHFSTFGWILVSAAVEAAANDEPFLTFMRENIFAPLGMDHTRADSNTDSIPDRVIAYFPRFAAEPRYGPDVNREIDYSCYAGSAAFLSTPSDLVRFATAINGGKLLQPDTARLLQTSQRLTSGEETGYGLGWELQTATIAGAQTPLVGHDGKSMGGMVGSFMTFPEYGIVVSVTANISYADTHSLAVKIAEAFAKQGKRPISK